MERLGVLRHTSAGGRAAPVGRPRCARGGGPLAALAGAWFLCTSADVRGVLSHSRERTKGRPVAAKPRQHHGCPRTPRRLGCGRNLLLREAIGFLAGAAWGTLGVKLLVRWRPGGTGGPPSLRARWWALWLRLQVHDSLAHRLMCGAFFPSRGKEPKGDRWQPNRDSTMAAPGPLVAWLEGEAFCCARLIPSSRGRLGAA